eukprot:TRINITY_DN13716_c0_g1_i1.p1 TRINITY_DN13716_c0_g1~~TRINITY_DN13716_c0_g1_i1.p1  ORF type:complete len:363 (+),score=76.18 TRINITY_DN13716_c0_g1_i1:82-1089(+)
MKELPLPSLMRVIGGLEKLEELKLNYCQIEDSGLQALVQSFRDDNRLRVLELQSNGLTGKSMIFLADALDKVLKMLESLNISGNAIGEIGIQRLSDSLKYRNTLATLRFEQCCLGDLGLNFACGAAESMPDLDSLTISGEDLTYFGPRSVASMIGNHRNLREVDLGNSNLDSDTIDLLGTAFMQNSSLRTFGAPLLETESLHNAIQSSRLVELRNYGQVHMSSLVDLLKTSTSLEIVKIPPISLTDHLFQLGSAALSNKRSRLKLIQFGTKNSVHHNISIEAVQVMLRVANGRRFNVEAKIALLSAFCSKNSGLSRLKDGPLFDMNVFDVLFELI